MKPIAAAPYFTLPRRAWAWATYDLANTVFSMNIITMYFAQWVVVDLGFEDIWYSVAYAASMALVGLTMPVAGAWADARGLHRRGLIIYTAACCALTAGLGLTAALPSRLAAGVVALAVFVGANYFYIGGQTFYNALLRVVAPPGAEGRVCGLGTALGYVGAIAGLALVWPFVRGWLPFLGKGRPAAFLPTAVFFALFSLPALLGIPGSAGKEVRNEGTWRVALRKVGVTLKNARRRPGVFKFLIGNFFLEDAIATAIVFMAVYAHKVFGFADDVKIILFVISTTFAVAGAALAGTFADKIGPRRLTVITAWGWAFTFVFIAAAFHPVMFWAGGALVGVGLGFTWTAVRPLLASMVGSEEQGEFFGLYALSSRVAAIAGPLLWGGVVWAGAAWPTGKYRLAVFLLAAMEVTAALIFGSLRPQNDCKSPRTGL